MSMSGEHEEGSRPSIQDSESSNELGFSGAIGRLAEQRSAAEQGAALIKRYAADDVGARMLYAQAKACFDGIIEQLIADLNQNRDPEVSQEFRRRLDAAVAKRGEFSARVIDILEATVPSGAKPAWLAALLAIPAELVKALFEGGIAIWHEWRTASAERRKQMVTRLEEQRWRLFSDIEPAE